MRSNGFDIKLQTNLGVKFHIEGEFYARPGEIVDVNFNNVVEPFPEPENMPIVVAYDPNDPRQNIHEDNQNIIYHEIEVNDRIIIENDRVIIQNVPDDAENDDQNNNNNIPNDDIPQEDNLPEDDNQNFLE